MEDREESTADLMDEEAGKAIVVALKSAVDSEKDPENITIYFIEEEDENSEEDQKSIGVVVSDGDQAKKKKFVPNFIQFGKRPGIVKVKPAINKHNTDLILEVAKKTPLGVIPLLSFSKAEQRIILIHVYPPSRLKSMLRNKRSIFKVANNIIDLRIILANRLIRLYKCDSRLALSLVNMMFVSFFKNNMTEARAEEVTKSKIILHDELMTIIDLAVRFEEVLIRSDNPHILFSSQAIISSLPDSFIHHSEKVTDHSRIAYDIVAIPSARKYMRDPPNVKDLYKIPAAVGTAEMMDLLISKYKVTKQDLIKDRYHALYNAAKSDKRAIILGLIAAFGLTEEDMEEAISLYMKIRNANPENKELYPSDIPETLIKYKTAMGFPKMNPSESKIQSDYGFKMSYQPGQEDIGCNTCGGAKKKDKKKKKKGKESPATDFYEPDESQPLQESMTQSVNSVYSDEEYSYERDYGDLKGDSYGLVNNPVYESNPGSTSEITNKIDLMNLDTGEIIGCEMCGSESEGYDGCCDGIGYVYGQSIKLSKKPGGSLAPKTAEEKKKYKKEQKKMKADAKKEEKERKERVKKQIAEERRRAKEGMGDRKY